MAYVQELSLLGYLLLCEGMRSFGEYYDVCATQSTVIQKSGYDITAAADKLTRFYLNGEPL